MNLTQQQIKTLTGEKYQFLEEQHKGLIKEYSEVKKELDKEIEAGFGVGEQLVEFKKKAVLIKDVEKMIDEFEFETYFIDADSNPNIAQRIILREVKPNLKQRLNSLKK